MRKLSWMMLPAALMLLVQVQAWASSFSVTPIVTEISAPGKIATYTLSNSGSTPLQIQVDGWSWTQQNGDDVQRAADGLTISPPVAVIPAGGSQIIRIARPADESATEQAFRIHFDEVPSAKRDEGVVLQTRLRLDVPLFFSPDKANKPITHWAVAAVHNPGRVAIGIINYGGKFDRYTALALYDADGTLLVRMNQPMYVLARSNRIWVKEVAHPVRRGDTVRLVVERNGALQEQRITVD